MALTDVGADRSVRNGLHFVYSVVPLVAGIDKFFHALVDWDQYLAEPIAAILPLEAHTFMLLVGVIEIAAGLLTMFLPRIGGLVVAAWLVGIAINLVIAGFYDIAVRDVSMAVGAWSLSRLTAPVTSEVPIGARRATVGP